MRDYARVYTSFWNGPTGKLIRAEGVEAQLVALYLLSAPTSIMTGLYYLPIPTLCHETGIPFEGASKALRSLERIGFAFYDHGREVVWVPEMASFQVEQSLRPSDKRWKGVVKEIERFKKSRFYREFYTRYKDDFSLPEPSPFEAPSKPLRSQDQDQDQEDLSLAHAHVAETLPRFGKGEFSAQWEAELKKTPSGNWVKLDEAAELCAKSAAIRNVSDVAAHARRLLQSFVAVAQGWRGSGRPAPQMSVEAFIRNFAACEEVIDGERDPKGPAIAVGRPGRKEGTAGNELIRRVKQGAAQ